MTQYVEAVHLKSISENEVQCTYMVPVLEDETIISGALLE